MLSLLLFLTLVCMPKAAGACPDSAQHPLLSAALSAACLGSVVGMAACFRADAIRLAVMARHRERASRRYGSWRLYHLVTCWALRSLLYGTRLGLYGATYARGQPRLPAAVTCSFSPRFMLSLIFIVGVFLRRSSEPFMTPAPTPKSPSEPACVRHFQCAQ